MYARRRAEAARGLRSAAIFASVLVASLAVVAIALGLPIGLKLIDAYAGTHVEDLTGSGLAVVTSSANTFNVDVALPADVARLADPAASCTGFVQQDADTLTCIPAVVGNSTIELGVVGVGVGAALAVTGTREVRGLRVNGTAGVAAAVVGDDVLLTVDVELAAVGAGAALAVAGTR